MNPRETKLMTEDLSQSEERRSNDRQARFTYEHQTCAMCDSELEVTHEINRTELKIREEAHCPSCGIRVRSSNHLMQ